MLITASWQCDRSGSVNILRETFISWGSVRLTVRWSLIKRLIGGDSDWGNELWPEVDILNIWHSPMFYYCTASLVHTFSYFIWCFISMFDTIMTMFQLTWRNRRWLWHAYARKGIIKTLVKRDWRFWWYFIPNLLEYTCTKNDQTRAQFNQAISKIKWRNSLCTSADIIYDVWRLY